MVAQVVVNDRVIGMVCLKQMLERSRSLLGVGLDIVNVDGRKVDLGVVSSESKE